MRKIVFPQESNLQPLDYRSTALPLELEKTPPRMLNFGYLNPATCLLYDCNNKSMKMFFDVCRPEVQYFNRFACFWPKGYQLGSLGKSHQNGDYLKQAMRKIVFPQESNLQPLDYRSTALPLELEKTQNDYSKEALPLELEKTQN